MVVYSVDCAGIALFTTHEAKVLTSPLLSLEQFSDLSKYQATHADGAVIAWPSKTNPNAEKLISIKIDANVLARKEGIEEPVEEKKDEEVKEEPKEDKQPEEKKADEKDEL